MDEAEEPELPEPDLVVDALGLLCPLPVLRARQALARLPEGGVVALLADDPRVEQDVPDWCAGSGHDLLSLVEEQGRWRCLVRRGQPGPRPG